MPKSFTAKFLLALLIGVAVAIVLAPFIAIVVARAGFNFPFPRIFDRVAMVALAIVMILSARSLRLLAFLRAGFARPVANLPLAARGLAVALGVIALLFAVAAMVTGLGHAGRAARMLPKYIVSAFVIAIIEEGFFRAFLFAGMKDDFGQTVALLLSSAIYAVSHLVRAPAHFYVTGLDLGAGVRTLGLSFTQFASPSSALATVLGLFLLGVVFAQAFVLTETVWFSAGLHAGFVLGAKLWPKVTLAHRLLPGWLDGWGHQPLISGAAAWIVALALLVLLRPLVGSSKRAL